VENRETISTIFKIARTCKFCVSVTRKQIFWLNSMIFAARPFIDQKIIFFSCIHRKRPTSLVPLISALTNGSALNLKCES
jgi:hypothetical protein